MAPVTSDEQIIERATHKSDIGKPSPPESPQNVLETCAAGQWSALQTIFDASGIVAPAPAITIHNQSKYALPQTHEMVKAAIRGKQSSIVEHIYKIFPSARSEYLPPYLNPLITFPRS